MSVKDETMSESSDEKDDYNVVLIENWSIASSTNPTYTPPELIKLKITGDIYGHPLYPNGSDAMTSAIQEIDGRYVRTKSRWYKLGMPDPKYIEWFKAKGHTLDLNNPIREITLSCIKK